MKNVIKYLAFIGAAFAFNSVAWADVPFSCIGNTTDGNTITVEGSYNSGNNQMTSDLTVSQSNDQASTSWKGGGAYRFGARAVVISPTNDYWTLSAQSHGEQVIIRHPDAQQDQTYMRVYLGSTFDHEFSHATCTFN